MPPAGRLGDKSLVPADSHGCPGCPHCAAGPAVTGSADVNINSLPALRVGDKGIHAACCGPNTWEAVAGAPTVFINGKPAHRLGDAGQHCGGLGRLIEGSSNVLIGNYSGGASAPSEPERPKSWIEISLVDEDGQPVVGEPYHIMLPDGAIREGTLDSAGRARITGVEPGNCHISFPELEHHQWKPT